ncbi:MAG: alpha/beta fold hydrolase, partial [Candidatus Eisenbacteria bacterium]|nr:alpha/beta fold hydrolase [Candidatus Latescibacterota bacterium]MBD3300865.1 alpha/beta fold hydrolase [Candidatus Eisenbacteria bacterium]
LLAVPAGLLAALGLLRSANVPLRFVFPWGDLAATVLILPSVVYAITWLFARRRGERSGPLPLARWILIAALPLAGSLAHAERAAPEVSWEPHTGVAFDGSPLHGDLGRIHVPENRNDPSGRTIEIAFVRYRTDHPDPGPPIFFLAGGPGGAGTALSGRTATHPQLRLLEHADVVGIDQRGTGLSRPALTGGADSVEPLPLDRPVDRADVLAAFRKAAGRRVRVWTERGVDVAAYNTSESADDLEAVRAALGAERIVTFGSSYGSHLGLAHLRRHPEHVARSVLSRVEGPNHTWKLPSTVQRCLERVHAMAGADPAVVRHVPDLLAAVDALLVRLEAEPVVAEPEREEETRIVLGPHDLRSALSRWLATTEGISGIPAAIHRFGNGDWTRLARFAREERRVWVDAMPLLMDCASGGTAERRARIERERRDPATLLSDALMAPFYPEACAACPEADLGEAFRRGFSCDVPVLFVSGVLDPRTPPENVEEIRAGFPNSAHLRVENAGHEARELMSEEFRDLMQSFLRGEEVRSCTIRLPPVQFEPIEAENRAVPGS